MVKYVAYLTFLFVLLVPSCALADFLEQSGGWPLTQAPASIAIALQGFNPALGTLNEVDLSVSDGASITATFFNPTPDPEITCCEPYVPVDILTPAGSEFASGGPTIPDVQGITLAGGESTTIVTGLESDQFGGSLTSPGDLQGFISSGDILITVNIGSAIGYGAGAGDGYPIATLDSTSSGGGFLFAYDYTPALVPEPSSGFLLISATMVMFLLAWVMQQRSSTRASTPKRLP